jgi:hypothetical protein
MKHRFLYKIGLVIRNLDFFLKTKWRPFEMLIETKYCVYLGISEMDSKIEFKGGNQFSDQKT